MRLGSAAVHNFPDARKAATELLRTDMIAAPSLDIRQADFAAMPEYAEAVEQPEDHGDHDEDVEDLFDRGRHRDVGIDEPEQHADDDQSENSGK
jgi:hypothetical protein